MMIAHLYIPSIDSTANLASTLSKKSVTDLLKTELGFKGLTFTDAFNPSINPKVSSDLIIMGSLIVSSI